MAKLRTPLKDTLATARAIHFAMRNGQITYEEAKERTQPLLEFLNAKVVKIAQKYGVKPRKITFQDLGRSF